MGILAHGRDRGRDRERGLALALTHGGGAATSSASSFQIHNIAAITNDNSEGARRDARASTQMKGASLDRPERAGKKMRRRMTEVYFIQAIYYYR